MVATLVDRDLWSRPACQLYHHRPKQRRDNIHIEPGWLGGLALREKKRKQLRGYEDVSYRPGCYIDHVIPTNSRSHDCRDFYRRNQPLRLCLSKTADHLGIYQRAAAAGSTNEHDRGRRRDCLFTSARMRFNAGLFSFVAVLLLQGSTTAFMHSDTKRELRDKTKELWDHGYNSYKRVSLNIV